MSNKKLNIALVAGGYTQETAVSGKSADNIRSCLNPEKYNVYKIMIEQNRWYYDDGTTDSAAQPVLVDRNDFSITVNGTKITFDCVFLHIAGSPGEDGKLQGYFDMINMPYVGCSNAISSALTMSKRMATAVAGYHGINVSKSVCVERPLTDVSVVTQQLQFPVFVKANNGGSSIDTSYVKNVDELLVALNQVFKSDYQALVEEALVGREFTVGVCKAKGKLSAFPITEILSNNNFNDFNSKYSGQSSLQTPAKLDKTLEDLIQSTAIKVYEIMQCSCIARVDFIYNEKDSKLYLLEVNSIPGQTSKSAATLQVEAMGSKLGDFYDVYFQEALNL